MQWGEGGKEKKNQKRKGRSESNCFLFVTSASLIASPEERPDSQDARYFSGRFPFSVSSSVNNAASHGGAAVPVEAKRHGGKHPLAARGADRLLPPLCGGRLRPGPAQETQPQEPAGRP